MPGTYVSAPSFPVFSSLCRLLCQPLCSRVVRLGGVRGQEKGTLSRGTLKSKGPEALNTTLGALGSWATRRGCLGRMWVPSSPRGPSQLPMNPVLGGCVQVIDLPLAAQGEQNPVLTARDPPFLSRQLISTWPPDLDCLFSLTSSPWSLGTSGSYMCPPCTRFWPCFHQ